MKIGQLLEQLKLVNDKTPYKKVLLKAEQNKDYRQYKLFLNFDDNRAAVIDIGGDETMSAHRLFIKLRSVVFSVGKEIENNDVFIQSCDENKEHTTDFAVINTAHWLILLENADSKAA